jgi:hypothetical protein
MPRKKSTAQKGKGIREILGFIKDKKLISQGLGLIPHPAGQAASAIANLVGLGKKKHKTHRKKQHGKGIFSDIFGGIGGGLGSVAHGLFGGAKHKGKKNVLIMK